LRGNQEHYETVTRLSFLAALAFGFEDFTFFGQEHEGLAMLQFERWPSGDEFLQEGVKRR